MKVNRRSDVKAHGLVAQQLMKERAAGYSISTYNASDIGKNLDHFCNSIADQLESHVWDIVAQLDGSDEAGQQDNKFKSKPKSFLMSKVKVLNHAGETGIPLKVSN